MSLSTESSGILMDMRSGLSGVSCPPCASCLFDLVDASGMVGGEPCPLKAALLRRYAQRPGPADSACADSCGGFVPGYAEASDDWASDFAGGLTRILS